MNRIIHYTMTSADSDISVSQYLKSRNYSRQNIVQLKKMPESILVNNKWVYVNHKLQKNDVLTIHIQEEASSNKIPPIPLPLTIVYEDEDILVMNKPAGMPIHPSLNHYENSLANGLAWYFEEQGKPFVFRCINRLDRDTSGLTIIAKHMVSAGILSTTVAKREIQREYLAIVKGSPQPKEGTINAPIARKSDSMIERVVDWEKGENAITHYQTITSKNGYSLMSLQLETGRTHQIRVHMKYLGYPLIGDFLYYPETELISRQALHSYRLNFNHPITGEMLEFTAPIPQDMECVLS